MAVAILELATRIRGTNTSNQQNLVGREWEPAPERDQLCQLNAEAVAFLEATMRLWARVAVFRNPSTNSPPIGVENFSLWKSQCFQSRKSNPPRVAVPER